MHLALVAQELQSLPVAPDRSGPLAQGALINIADNMGSSMSWRIVNCGSTAQRPAAVQIN